MCGESRIVLFLSPVMPNVLSAEVTANLYACQDAKPESSKSLSFPSRGTCVQEPSAGQGQKK